MYKYKQTTDVKVNDLVVWTELLPNNPHITKDKVYKVLGKINNNLVTVLSDNNTEVNLGKAQGFKVLQTKPASEAVVGDYMYRISSGSGTFSQHSVIKITRTGNERLGYSEELGVDFYEVIVIAQAEPEVKYPLFMQWKATKVIVKFDGFKSGTQLTKDTTYNAGVYRTDWFIHSNTRWEPCDFTIEPEIFDLDWWQARYEEGLDVYVRDGSGPVYQCIALPPKDWSKCCTFGMTYSSLIPNLCNEIHLGATTECSLPNQTTKEQPMKLQQLLDTIFGVSDYEAKPKFIVTVFNNDKEVGTTTADSVEEIQQTIQSDTRLWGCKLVAYKIHSELQTQVPVAITKFKKESNA